MKVVRGLKILLCVDTLNTYQLTPTMYVILYYIYHKLSVSVGPNMKRSLIKVGMLEDIEEEIKLTEKAILLFYEDPKQWSDKKIKEFLTELREEFPKGVKISGSPVRTTIGSSTVRKMKNFFKEYGYSQEVVVQATKAYVADRKKDNYQYMKKYTNFINKQGEDSLLATWCEMIVNKEEEANQKKLSDYNIKLDEQ